jgi:NAD(P)-dependent dehydrogenase (short-subunit alcohol dehydrogenase family)
MPTVVVTGANRGLGLEFVRQYRADGWSVLASCRFPAEADALQALGAEVAALDVADNAAVTAYAGGLGGRPVDLLINNAGVMDPDGMTFDNVDPEIWDHAFRVNSMAPLLLTRALLPCLKLAPRPVAATVGSQAGIFAFMQDGERVIYRSTKAGAHAVTLTMSHALREHGVIHVSLRPGRTSTRMGGADAPYEIADSVARMRRVLTDVTMEQAGCFVDRTGEVFPYAGR